MDQSSGNRWVLESGTWSMDDGDTAARLSLTKMGFTVAPVLQQADLIQVMHMRSAPGGTGPAYPPEFSFSPRDGAALPPAPRKDGVWIGPSGARPLDAPTAALATGLKQTAQTMNGALLQRRAPDSDPEREMPLPPPGAYEFFCAPFGTLASVLLAVDPGKGALFAWLPASAAWQPMVGDERPLSESALAHRSWRAELMTQFNSCLFLPTDNGLAMVMPDFPSLSYCVAYIGEGRVPAAPVAFEGRIWAPNVDRNGAIQIISVDSDGEPGAPLAIPGLRELGEVGRPMAYGRMAVWPSTKGQLCLNVDNKNGNVVASFIPWAPALTPHFEFGSAFLSRAGVLWQLCFSSALESYVYVRLGTADPEQAPALTPRMCSGTVNYRFSTMLKADPWLEPEHGDDGAANMVVFPLLELGNGGVLALKLASTSGLTELLHSRDRMRAELIFEDHSSAFTIQTISAPQPWELRVFFYQGALWVYHPSMQRIIGWQVDA